MWVSAPTSNSASVSGSLRGCRDLSALHPALLDIALGRMQEGSQCESPGGYRLEEESNCGEVQQLNSEQGQTPSEAVHALNCFSCRATSFFKAWSPLVVLSHVGVWNKLILQDGHLLGSTY